jgi:hypothetical protein
MNDKGKQMECLFAWAEFYSNSKNLAVPVVANFEAFNKTKEKILKLKTELID